MAGMPELEAQTDSIRFRVEGEPLPMERPRRGRAGQFYTPNKKGAQESFAWACKMAVMGKGMFLGPVGVFMYFHLKNMSSDLDNLQKTALDSFTKIAYVDDRQVELIMARKLRVEGDPYTDIEIVRLEQ